jgi:opacity protein-like surface antigen
MRALLLVAVFAALALAGGAAADNPTLFATVGPGFSIRVADGAGNPITRIPPGTYTVKVSDLAAVHNFHLTGPGGFDMSTTVEGTGTAEWTVTFQAGTYHYQCDPHSTTLKGDITVEAGAPLPTPGTTTTAPTTTTTPAPPPPGPVRRLAGSVGPGATIALRVGARKLTALKAGPVVFTVRDLSAKDNFHLTGPGVNRTTSRAGKTTVTWRLTLKRGLYVYRSDATPRLRGSFRVT